MDLSGGGSANYDGVATRAPPRFDPPRAKSSVPAALGWLKSRAIPGMVPTRARSADGPLLAHPRTIRRRYREHQTPTDHAFASPNTLACSCTRSRKLCLHISFEIFAARRRSSLHASAIASRAALTLPVT